DGDKRVVYLTAEQISAGARRLRDFARRRRHEIGNLLERTVGERIEDAIKLDTHRVRNVVAGPIVRRSWRSARIRDVVRMILRLEHVQQVRAERLRALHDVRTSRILLARPGGWRSRTVDDAAGLGGDVEERGG